MNQNISSQETVEDIYDKIWDAGHYGPEGVHEIVRVPGSKWIIVDSWYSSYEPGKPPILLGLDIHYDDDDPNAVKVDPKLFEPLIDGKKQSEALWRRHARSTRLALRRATDSSLEYEIANAEERALAYLALAKARREDPESPHIVVNVGRWTVGHHRKEQSNAKQHHCS